MRNRILLVVVALVIVVGIGVVALRSVGGGGQDRTIDIAITGKKMAPDTITVKQNDNVTLNITGDHTEEIHIHGYDLLKTIEAGKSGVYKFRADKSGDYEIEIETTSTTVGHLVVNP